MRTGEVVKLIRDQAEYCGMTPAQYAEAMDAITPPQIEIRKRLDRIAICAWMQPNHTSLKVGDLRWWAARYRESYLEYSARELDLDALWQVEDRLSDAQWDYYEGMLLKIARKSDRPNERTSMRRLIHATAEQKITALARAIREVPSE